jgi:medium-chain acyl-[acyl-carrier-protein] hydrolase
MQARTKLFIFPHAGGSDLSYASMEKSFSPVFDCFTVCYPGRGRRYNDKFVKNIGELVEDCLSFFLSKHDGEDFFFMGHSFGSLVAFECMRVMQSDNMPQPAMSFLSGKSAPSHVSDSVLKHKLDDEQLILYLKKLGGIPNDLADNQSFISFYLPIIRHDLALIENYEYKQSSQLNVPLVLINGTNDLGIKSGSIQAWQQETTEKCHFENMAGGHFFNLENQSFTNLICSFNEKCNYNISSV